MKLISMYLPQFHETENNNKWWGAGYTDWTAAKNAVNYCSKQHLPRIPLNKNYYNLADENASTWKWQAELAKKYGIYGFAIYHYWFAGVPQLEKPVEILRQHKEIDIHYMFCWDSASWRRTWYGNDKQEILMEQNYGNEEMWTKHFMDLLPFFQDERYIKIGNRPVFIIYRAHEISCLNGMRIHFERLAKQNGYDGIYLIAGDLWDRSDIDFAPNIDAFYNYEPNYSYYQNLKKWYGFKCVVTGGIKKRLNRLFHTKFLPYTRDAKGMYQCIIRTRNKEGMKTYYGIFSDYDDTPRKQNNGIVYTDNSVELFRKALSRQVEKSLEEENEFLFITAWNEWGESAYLEPDEQNGYAYLQCIKEVLETKGEL